jgi:hypothetical protein
MSQVTPPGYLSRLGSWAYGSYESLQSQAAPLHSSFPSWDAVFDLANRVKYYALAAIGLFVLYKLSANPKSPPSSGTASSPTFTSDLNPIWSTVSINRHTATAFVGRDQSYGFGKKLQLANGDLLKIDPSDLMYSVEIITTLPNGNLKVKYKVLPSSLFSQARIGDTISYNQIKNNKIKSYKLQLVPCQTPIINPDRGVEFSDKIERMQPEIHIEHHFFDQCENIVKERAKNPGIDFFASQDIPEGYAVIDFDDQFLFKSLESDFVDFRTITNECTRLYNSEKRLIDVRRKTSHYETPTMRMFRSCAPAPEGYLCISRGNEAYTLSPDTKRIYLNQIGVSPCNLNEVEVQSRAHPAKYVSSLHETQCTLTIEAPGKPALEILLDDRRLFVTLKCDSNYQEFLCESFKNEAKAIDESKISATLNGSGILTITIPFTTK